MKINQWILVLSGVILTVIHSLVFASPPISSPSAENPSLTFGPAKPDQQAAISVPSQSPAGAVEEPVEAIADPLEPVNRVFFQFNDKLYFWVLKPVATGYKAVFPEPVRVGVKNFFSNVTTPIRFVNCLLQGNFRGAGNETVRLMLNSTLGLAGFLDPAKKELKIEKQEEDFGQTLGVWGIGPLLYIEWPILGASSARDSVGYVGDLALDPRTYLIASVPANLGVRSYEEINDHSLTLGEYEDLKKAAVDPYVAKRDAFNQYRQNKIKERGKTPQPPASRREPQGFPSVQAGLQELTKDRSSFYSF